MLDRAIRIAVKCHTRQVRKHVLNGHRLPYIVHPIEVMKTVWTWGAARRILWRPPCCTTCWKILRSP